MENFLGNVINKRARGDGNVSVDGLQVGDSFVSYEQYCKYREDNPELRIEFIIDHIRILASESPAHTFISKNVVGILDGILQKQSCRAVSDGFSIRFDKSDCVEYKKDNPTKNFKVYQPDASIICGSKYVGIEYTGEVKLVVEVLSKGTKDVDEGEKLETYSKNGIESYWIVDPRDKSVAVLTKPGVRIIEGKKQYIYYSNTRVRYGEEIEYNGTTINTMDFFKNIFDSEYIW